MAWRLVDRGKLLLHSLSHGGLEPIDVKLAGRWEYPVKAVALARGVLTFVATDAVGIVDVNAGTVARHERWTAAAWIDPGSGDVYSVREVDGEEDAYGLPPVALAREAVQSDGGLRLLASTEPWPATQPVEEGSIDEIGHVHHRLVAMGDEVVLLRGHSLGTGRLQIATWDKATLRNRRAFGVDTRSPGGVLSAMAVGERLVVAVVKYRDEPVGREPVRLALEVRDPVGMALLQIDRTGAIRKSVPPPIHDEATLIVDMEMLQLGRAVYAVSTQSSNIWNARLSQPVTIDALPIQHADP